MIRKRADFPDMNPHARAGKLLLLIVITVVATIVGSLLGGLIGGQVGAARGHLGDEIIGDALVGGAVGSILLGTAAALIMAPRMQVSRAAAFGCAAGCLLGVALFFLYVQPRYLS